MTAQEFGEWRVWFHTEQQHPAADRLRHAQMLASLTNGPLTRKSGGMFATAEFLPPDPWAPPPPPAREQTIEEIAAQIEAINSRME